MLFIPKPKKDKPELRTVIDLRERNKNTKKLTSPLPDIEGILCRLANKPYRSSLDMKAAYEQIRVIPEHLPRTAMTTPDGNMVSHVVQQGDCNAPATYQALMNHIFSSYIGRFMDVYLDDIVIYSGHIIDDEGIRMDPAKVDSVLAWKTPTNRDLLRGFLGSVGYLADDIPGVRIPMGILSAITGDTVPFRWGFTEQRAFEDVKNLVHKAREHRRKPLDYSPGAPPIWMVTDGCATGIAGVISQGDDWRTAKVAAFYSAKLNDAQRNYPTHEWVTDHKGLIHLLDQDKLSGRKARWLEKISSFDFTVAYVPGTENVLADSLSRIYSNDAPGTVRAPSEYTYFDVQEDDSPSLTKLTAPVLTGLEALAAVVDSRRTRRIVPPAESGRPENDKEWAARIAATKSFALRGPQEQEGETQRKSNEVAVPEPPLPKKLTIRIPGKKKLTPKAVVPEPVMEPQLEGPVLGPTLWDMVQFTGGVNMLEELRGKYINDSVFKPIVENPSQFRNFEVTNGLIYLKEDTRRLLCIPRITIDGRNARELVIDEAHSLLAHLGASKTIAYLRERVWWKDLVSDTKAFCETCITCKRSKPDNQKPYGLLNPLPEPTAPWEAVGVDFVGPLPVSSNRNASYDSLTVIICLLTGMVHLVPCRTDMTAKEMAELMFEEVYKHHGLPRDIVSDRDRLFTSVFWQRLHRLMGTKLRMSSAYHPQTDGSTERANRTVTQMLRQCISDRQTDWVQKIPAVEFAINSSRSESTGYSPFFLNNGRLPRAMIWDSAGKDKFPAVRDWALKKKLAVMEAHDSILAARVKQTREANRHRRVAPFAEGDLVYVSTKNMTFPRGLARKLVPKYTGPYKILQDFNNYSFRIELPDSLKSRGVHDVFHASLLRIHKPNNDQLFPGRLDSQITAQADDVVKTEWAIDQILSHKGTGKHAAFEVRWKAGDITWLPYDQVRETQAISEYFEALEITEIGDLVDGKGSPPIDEPELYLGGIGFMERGRGRGRGRGRSKRGNLYRNSSYPHSHHDSRPRPQFDYDTTRLSRQVPEPRARTRESMHTTVWLQNPNGISPCPELPSINQPGFIRTSDESYFVEVPYNPECGCDIPPTILSASQLHFICMADNALRKGQNIDALPAGYKIVAEITNNHWPAHSSGLAYVDIHGIVRVDKEPLQIAHFHFNRKMYERKNQDPTRYERAVTALVEHNFADSVEAVIGPTTTGFSTPALQSIGGPYATPSGSGMGHPLWYNSQNAQRRVHLRNHGPIPPQSHTQWNTALADPRGNNDRDSWRHYRPSSSRGRSPRHYPRQRDDDRRSRSRGPHSYSTRRSRCSPTLSPTRRSRSPSPTPRDHPAKAPEPSTLNGGRVDPLEESPIEIPTPALKKLSLLERIESATQSQPDSTWGNHLDNPDDLAVSVKTLKIPKRKKKASKAKAKPPIDEGPLNDDEPAPVDAPITTHDQLPLDSSTQLWKELATDPAFSPSEPTVDHLFDAYINSTPARGEDRMAVDDERFVDENNNPWEPDEEMGPG
ncbi:hypothetical protein MD484_g7080, partial [Candolleomyces efflorescens]